MLLFAIESSCDETAAAVISADTGTDTLTVLSSEVASQIAIHSLYGGVVPEIASRAHIETVSGIAYRALTAAGVTPADLDCVCVTAEPGLVGSLLVGVNFAKAFAYANHLPLIPVHHIKGHIAANYLGDSDLKPPFAALVVSGGHTSLLEARSHTEYHTVGRTRDDAVGEAFDKVARILGLPYPGGAEMDKLATEGDPLAIRFPSAALSDGTLDFSFSGLKTAVLNYAHTLEQRGEALNRADVAASFTRTVCQSVLKKTEMMYQRQPFSRFVLAGGVAANSHLRRAITEFCEEKKIRLYLPPLSLCGDNAAMIGAAGYFEWKAGVTAPLSLNARPYSAL